MTRRGMQAADSLAPEPEATPQAPAVRTAKSKLSVTLQPQQYYELVTLCAEETQRAGKRVTHQAVLVALVRELLADSDTRAKIMDQVKQTL